ncbi:MAG: flagellar hook-associated protein FlgK [Gammaproteobacteria bacterium]
MGLSGLIGQGLSGLVASQRGLATTGHNISNANTPGYHRQRVELGARLPQGSSNGFIGKGVAVNTIRRSYDQFLTAQIRTSTAGSGEAQTFHELASRVDNLLANADTGLASSLQSFFDAVHEVAADPTSLANRQVLLSEAEGLAQRYHALNGQLTDLQQEANGRLTGLVSEVNALTEGIAEMNREIVQAEGAAGGQPANDLRDRRDELLRQLAEQIGFHTVQQDDGAINVLIGNGHPLVVGGSNMSLSVVANSFDPTRKEIAVSAGGSSTIISDTLSGGAIGGILDFRDRVLNKAENALDAIVVGLTQSFNEQHRRGTDLDGNPGLDFFVPIDAASAREFGLAIHEPREIAAALPDALGGVGDNRNALELAKLQEMLTLENNNATFSGAYGQLVASVGAVTQKAEAHRSAQEALLSQVTDARDAVSGVNLDEEAANLLRYQQAYEASARVIAAADATFNSLLDVVGR